MVSSSTSTSTAPSTVTIGPYHPALPGPMRLRLDLKSLASASPLGWGAQIASAEIELGYNYLGLEERAAAGVDWAHALSLVEGLCSCCSQANTLAYVQAVESMALTIVPPRAAYIRMVLAETERIISHLLNAAETMQALHLYEREAVLRDLCERAVQALDEWAGARVQPGIITYGGLSRNIDEAACRGLTLAIRHVERILRTQISSIINNREIAARLAGLGAISAQEATVAGLRGPVARASSIATDIRVAFPTGAYEEEGVTIVVQRNGDAFARLVVRLLEALESMRIIEQGIDDLPSGPVRARGVIEMKSGSGIGRVEGPKGEIFCWIRGEATGLRALHLSTASFPTLGILPGLLRNRQLEDLRLLLLSVDLCMACVER